MGAGNSGGGAGIGPDSGWDRERDRFADLPPVDVAIPDDASELDEDVRAYFREQQAAAEQATAQQAAAEQAAAEQAVAERARPGAARHGHRLPPRGRPLAGRWRTYGLSGPLLLVILLVVALVGALAALLAPRDPPVRPVSPLSTRATAAPGRAGALLPAGTVRIDGVPIDLRGLRPAVFALVPPGCACETGLEELFARAAQYRLELLLVPTSTRDTKEFRDLVARVGNGSVQPAEDADAALRTAYQPRGLTVVLVRADGVVSAVHRGLGDLRRLELDLARLAHPEVPR